MHHLTCNITNQDTLKQKQHTWDVEHVLWEISMVLKSQQAEEITPLQVSTYQDLVSNMVSSQTVNSMKQDSLMN